LTGNMSAAWSFIDDSETYNNPSPVRVYPAPAVYNRVTDLRGSPNFG
jgi:hypothetical protein